MVQYLQRHGAVEQKKKRNTKIGKKEWKDESSLVCYLSECLFYLRFVFFLLFSSAFCQCGFTTTYSKNLRRKESFYYSRY